MLTNNNRKEKALLAMRNLELFHELVYMRMARSERNKTLKRTLVTLAKGERAHARLWGALLLEKPENEGTASMMVSVSILHALKRISGVALIVKMMERIEFNKYRDLDRALANSYVNRKEEKAINTIRKIEERTERPLENMLISQGAVLSNIRDVIFGMSDSLVEVLAAVTGLGAALRYAPFVFVAGLIIAVSGTLSMASGAYLSTNYESKLDSDKRKKAKSASKSAYYVGLFYFVGALFPISPFAFGIGGYSGILLSTVVTMAVLSVVSVIMAVVSDTKILRSMAKTLLVSLCAVVVTVLLGVFTRSVLHINI